jgi:trimethylamine:corrinoid methyltransferase-like protein
MIELDFAGTADVEAIGDACLTVLERVGMVFQNDEILTALEAWGARVDHSRQVATFPRQALAQFVAGLRAEASAPRDPHLPCAGAGLGHRIGGSVRL